jgi:hypothetical protein
MTEDDVLALRQALPGAVWVSARTGTGIDALRELIATRLPHPDVDVEVLVPYDRVTWSRGCTGTGRCSASGTRSPAPGSVPGRRGAGRDPRGVRRTGRVRPARGRDDHGQVTARYGEDVTSGVVSDAGAPEKTSVVSAGRPAWWAMVIALVVGALVTADVLSRGWLERMDLRVSDVISGWELRDSGHSPSCGC